MSFSEVSGRDNADDWMLDRNKELFERYLGLQNGNMEPSSLETRESNLRRYIHYLQENDYAPTYIDGFDSSDHSTIVNFVSYLQNEGLSDTSISSAVSGVMKFYTSMSEMGAVDTHPFAKWTIDESDVIELDQNVPKQVIAVRRRGLQDGDGDHNHSKIAIPEDQVKQLLEHPGNPPLLKTLLIRLLWETGMRTGELAEVKLSDIDREKREIMVNSEKIQNPEHKLFRRPVTYSQATEDLLTQWIDFGERVGYCSEDISQDEGYLLVTDQSAQTRPTWLSRVVKRAAKRAGINEILYNDGGDKNRWLITGHTLRHSHISHHVNVLDTPIMHVSNLAGHKSLESTQGYISRDFEETLEHGHRFHEDTTA